MGRRQQRHSSIEPANNTDQTNGVDPAVLLDQLASHQIRVPTRNDVAAYISRHLALGELLPEIGAQARQAFGPDAELSLEVYRDPEVDDLYLTLYVRHEKY